ncbi:hypothetical protein ACQPZP_04060 [Spirillospora sp. CA-142024]|uniref:hypothetical protein n=1 Tax=Spirillospora sp. CA-142024 TaxID=3240036 RepID=UPI003D8A335B
MRRVASVTVLTGALAAGLFAAGPAAQAQAKPAAPFKEASAVSQGLISKKDLVAEAKKSGGVTAKDQQAIAAATYCRSYTRYQGYKFSNGNWVGYVGNKLYWCYNGSRVTYAKATFKYYTYNKYRFVPRYWVHKSLTHRSDWAYATSYAQVKFYYTGNGKNYYPYANVRGYRNGAYRWTAGG